MRTRILKLLLTIVLAACAPVTPAPETGTLQFRANGEDFVRQGLTAKDGWTVAFEHVYIHLGGITAFQSDPPYDAHAGGAIQSKTAVALPGTFTVDLAEGNAEAEPLLVGEVVGAPTGHYNALAFHITPATDGPAAPHALVISGTAEKDGIRLPFTLNIAQEFTFTCGEYVGEARKGILTKDNRAELEMTFHLDHIFGDAGTPLDDSLNTGAPGFEPFAALAQDGAITADQETLAAGLDAATYSLLMEALSTLGHVGEGHCHESLMD